MSENGEMSNLNDRQFGEAPDPDDDDWGYMRHGPMFHGTDADLKPGDRLEPRTRDVAYATPHHHTAKGFAKARGGRIYEVKPVADDHWVDQMKYTGGETHLEVVSKTGFEVVRKVPKTLKPDSPLSAEYMARREEARTQWQERTGRTKRSRRPWGFERPEA
jgi:hypothetical protein